MARLLIFLPTVCAFIAFILSILCLFAGTKKAVLSGTDILTVSWLSPHWGVFFCADEFDRSTQLL